MITPMINQAILNSHRERLLTLEQRFNDKIIGQTEAVTTVSRIITNVVSGFYESRSPLSVLLFAGTTGVGKTEMGKMIADEMGWPLHRFDMSEYSEPHKVATFIGAPPGYVGHGTEGALINALKQTPCVVLFDEVEKAHRAATRLFLQLFDEGRLTSSSGVFVEAKQVFFIMTTNIGSELFEKDLPLAEIRKKMEQRVKEHFSAEFYGRIHQVVVFKPLTPSSVLRIGKNYFKKLVSEIEQNALLAIRYDEPVLDQLIKTNFDLNSGARGIQRRIKEVFTHVLAKAFLEGSFTNGDAVALTTAQSGELCVRKDPNLFVVHVDQRFLNAEKLIGKWAIEYAYYPHPELITKVENKIVSMKTHHGSGMRLASDKWILPDPTIDARAFLENRCSEIADANKKSTCQRLLAQIFDESHIKTLSLDFPLEDLKLKVKDNSRLVRLSSKLQNLLGDFIVKVHNPLKFDEEQRDFERRFNIVASILKVPPSYFQSKTKQQNYKFPLISAL